MIPKIAKKLLSSVAALSLLLLGGNEANAAPTVTESGRTCTIVGTAKSETIKGTSRNDVICGLGGNDVIVGGSGADVLDGGSGTDTLRGGAGNDALFGGSGDDLLQGEAGVDTFQGGEGLNSCDLGNESTEIRDFTCSLLPKLSYMLVRVSGRIVAPPVNFDGCSIQLHDFDSEAAATRASAAGIIYSNGRFTIDAPPGDYSVWVNSLSNSDFSKALPQLKSCQAQAGVIAFIGNLIVDESFVPITVKVESLKKTRVFITNSKGQLLQGVKVYGNADYARASISPSDAASNILFGPGGDALIGITNKSGYVDAVMPAGKFTLRGKASFAGINLSGPEVAVTGNPAAIILKLGK